MSTKPTTKVLVQIHGVELGGSQINAVDLASAVSEHGFDCLLVAPRDTLPDGPSLLEIAAERQVRLELVDRPQSTLQGARMLNRLAAENGAAIVHTYGERSSRHAYWGPCFLARRPLVMTLYEMHVAPIEYAGPSLIVGTQYLTEDLRERRGRVELISPPVDMTRDDPQAVADQEFLSSNTLAHKNLRIVIVSRLTRSYRPFKSNSIELAIRAVAALGQQDVDLVIVGTGDDEVRLRQVGEEANARLRRRAVVFTGPMADPRPAYASADVVIGMGGSAARGLAFGKPLVVAGEFGWFRTFRPSSASGLFRNSFWSEDRAADPLGDLVRELRYLLSDCNEREDLGRFSRQFAESKFGLHAMAERLANVYDEAQARYRPLDWVSDLSKESIWARAWLDRHGPPRMSGSKRTLDRARKLAGLTHSRGSK